MTCTALSFIVIEGFTIRADRLANSSNIKIIALKAAKAFLPGERKAVRV
jgi:hypothetical protein